MKEWENLKTAFDDQTGGTERKQRAGMEIKIKLYDAKEELPKRSGEYLCFIGGTCWTNLPYSTKHKRFNAHDTMEPEHAFDVLFWAELPEMPEEEYEDES